MLVIYSFTRYSDFVSTIDVCCHAKAILFKYKVMINELKACVYDW